MTYSIPDIAGLDQAINWMKSNLSQKRLAHVFRVAEYSKAFSSRFKLTKEESISAEIASLLHDITKEQPPEFHTKILLHSFPEKTNLPFPVQHAWTGPSFVMDNFFKLNLTICQAMWHHTTGVVGMGLTEKVVFIADHFGSLPEENFIASMNKTIDQLCLEKITRTLNFLIEKRMPIVQDTLEFYNNLVNNE